MCTCKRGDTPTNCLSIFYTRHLPQLPVRSYASACTPQYVWQYVYCPRTVIFSHTPFVRVSTYATVSVTVCVLSTYMYCHPPSYPLSHVRVHHSNSSSTCTVHVLSPSLLPPLSEYPCIYTTVRVLSTYCHPLSYPLCQSIHVCHNNFDSTCTVTLPPAHFVRLSTYTTVTVAVRVLSTYCHPPSYPLCHSIHVHHSN